MGLIQDQRPRDWAYMATFDEKDLPSLQKMARHIRETHDVSIIEDFNLKCEQKLTGQRAVLDNGIEIQSVIKTGDLIVNTGLQQCINIILGTSSARWSHFGMSSVTNSVPSVASTALVNESIVTRVSLAWNEPVGMRLFFGGITSQTQNPTANYAPGHVEEIGVYNGSAAGAILLNRSVFANNAIEQDNTSSYVESAPIVLSSVIEFCPVV